jgi:hypothetical protein
LILAITPLHFDYATPLMLLIAITPLTFIWCTIFADISLLITPIFHYCIGCYWYWVIDWGQYLYFIDIDRAEPPRREWRRSVMPLKLTLILLTLLHYIIDIIDTCQPLLILMILLTAPAEPEAD